MATKLLPHECLIKMEGRERPLKVLTSAVEHGTYPGATIVEKGKPVPAPKAAKASTTEGP